MTYSKELLAHYASQSINFSDLCHNIGLNAGGSSANLKKRCHKLGIDTSHFTGRSWSKGQPSNKRIPWQKRLVLRPKNSNRVRYKVLKTALLESGRIYQCSNCKLKDEWNGKKLLLQIDHINGQRCDDRPENLRFICPNCHSQTETYGNKKRMEGSPNGMAPSSKLGIVRELANESSNLSPSSNLRSCHDK